MKIKKYQKVSKNKYKIILEDDSYLTLYEDVILKHELLLKKEINNQDLILKDNNKYELYEKCLIYLNKKLRCEKEIIDFLNKYTIDFKEIDEVIKKLKENGFLNQSLYLKSYIHDKIYLTNDGPIKIKKDLLNLDFQEEDIDLELNNLSSELIKNKIQKYVNKKLKFNKSSLYLFKNKMLGNLLNLGYLKDDIFEILNNIEIDNNNLKEKEYLKLKNKYAKKYSGYELEMFIKRKLYEKGFRD